MTHTALFLQTWAESRTRFTNLLKDIRQEDLVKRLANTKNSAGFLIRHIADVELLFAKNVFGAADVKVQAKTVIAQRDTGEWTNVEELLAYQEEASAQLKAILERQNDEDWSRTVVTKEFGTKTKAEAIA